MPLDQTHALEILNILGPFDGRRLRADIVRNNLNGRLPRPLTGEQFQDLMREMESRGWISHRVDEFGNWTWGIKEDGQILREQYYQ